MEIEMLVQPEPVHVEDEEEIVVVSDDDSDHGSEDYPPSLDVEEVDEPIEPDDAIIISGYYPVGAYFGNFQDAWGRRLPTPIVGRTVFCGRLQSDPDQKVEVELSLQKSEFTPTAVATMRRVVHYSKEPLYAVRSSYQETAIRPLPSKKVEEYSCPFFSVSDHEWYHGRRGPFEIADGLFVIAE